MLFSDLRRIREKTAFECSVCIVGAGPAGITLATELANSSLQVIVVESGSKTKEDEFTTGLNEIESIGAPRVMKPQMVRNRVLGGSSHTWYGRCAPLDAIDYAARPWVPYSGWPVSFDEMAPYVERSTKHLGLGPALYTDGLAQDSRLARYMDETQSLADSLEPDLRVVTWQFSSRSSLHNDYVRFGLRFRSLRAANIRVLTQATVTQVLTTEDGGHVTGVEVRTPEGKAHVIHAQRVVLCGGGIENARMLLASNQIEGSGLGNGRGLVGRFFMDHPRTTAGTFTPESAPAVQRELGLFRAPSGVRVQCGLSLSLGVQRREGLLNCAAWTTQHVADDDAWRSLRKVSLGKGDHRLEAALVLCKNANQIALDLWGKLVFGKSLTRRLKQLDLDITVEQAPNPDSRIRLSSRRDALNVPLSQIDWKISELERRSVVRLSHATNATLARAGLPQAKLVDWIENDRPEDAVFSDPAHPIGSTRMAVREEDGVVDCNGKVFGVDNLYIAGSSVFPTGGHANPTLMIVALTLRLADHLLDLSPGSAQR